MKKTKIILADGNHLFADALKLIIENDSDFVVISSVESGIDAVREVQVMRPDILVIGEVLPDITMFQLARELRRNIKNIRFLFIVRAGSTDLLALLGETVSVGAIEQKTNIIEFMTALRSVARGERYISRGVITNLINPVQKGEKYSDPLDDITQREREVLYWLANGCTNKEISKKMFLSEKTIKNHVSHILKKLDLADRTKAAALAWKEGLPMIPEEFYSTSNIN